MINYINKKFFFVEMIKKNIYKHIVIAKNHLNNAVVLRRLLRVTNVTAVNLKINYINFLFWCGKI